MDYGTPNEALHWIFQCTEIYLLTCTWKSHSKYGGVRAVSNEVPLDAQDVLFFYQVRIRMYQKALAFCSYFPIAFGFAGPRPLLRRFIICARHDLLCPILDNKNRIVRVSAWRTRLVSSVALRCLIVRSGRDAFVHSA